MFDIGWGELVVIGVVALIAIGPKELPGVLRSVGQWTGKIRRMASEFQGQFQEAMREAEMADVKKQVDELTSSVSDYTKFDPLAETQRQFDSAFKDAAVDKPVDTQTSVAPPTDVPVDMPALPEPVPPAEFAAPEPPKDGGGGRPA